MSKTLTIGRLYVTTTMQQRGAPLVDRAVTHGQRTRPATFEDGTLVTPERIRARSHQEILRKIVMPPAQKLVGDGYAVRLPFTNLRPARALVVGLWRK